jgi:hypothetical protein
MNKITQFLLTSLILIPAIAYSQAKQSLSGFQDIPWGASVEAVRNKFPQIKSYDGCRSDNKDQAEGIRNFFKKNDISCISYNFDKYIVNGISFYVIFSFTLENKLKSVVISKNIEGNTARVAPECQSIFTKMNNLLEIKYGGGTVPKGDADLFGYKALGFQSHDARYWVVGQTQIHLSNSWDHKQQPIFDYCQVNIDYIPSQLAAANKL